MRLNIYLILFFLTGLISCNPAGGGSDSSIDSNFGAANDVTETEDTGDSDSDSSDEQDEAEPGVCEVSENTSRSPFANSNDGSAGTSSNPFVICTLSQLNNVRDYLDSHFDLMANIDASETQTWGDYVDPDATPNSNDEYYEGFEPIGNCATSSCNNVNDDVFTGSFDGNNYKISDLHIQRPDEEQIALFRSTCRDSTVFCTDSADFIQNLELENIYVEGDTLVAGLVSLAYGTTIKNITISGEARGIKVGGVTFDIYGTIENVHATMDIFASDNPIGGISALFRYGNISNSSFTGDIQGEGDTGGIVGYIGTSASVASTYIDQVFYKGDLTGTSANGGIVGGMSSSQTKIAISNSYVDGNITATSDNVGGVVGSGRNLELVNVFFNGTVTGRSSVGGLVGQGNGTSQIKNSFARGSVIGSGAISWSNAGGLAAAGVTLVENSYSNLTLVQATRRTGGLLAEAYTGQVTNSYSASYIDTNNTTYCSGGLVGCSDGVDITTSFATGDIDVMTGTNDRHGPLVGWMSGTPATDYTDLFYSSAITLTNTGGGTVTDHSTFATSEALSYFQGPLNAANSNANEIYENWNFTTVWEIANGELPKLRCPATDDAGTSDITEVWSFACSVWNNAQ